MVARNDGIAGQWAGEVCTQQNRAFTFADFGYATKHSSFPSSVMVTKHNTSRQAIAKCGALWGSK